MKIAHVVNYAPGLSGMYNSVRDLVLGERKLGNTAEVIDTVASPIKYGTDGITPVPTSFGDQADIICWHHAMADDWLNEPHRNIVLFLHGTPEFNFYTELYSDDKTLSLIVGAAKEKIAKSFVTMWKRHVPIWEALLKTKVDYVPAWVNLNEWKVSSLPPEEDRIRISLMDFSRLSREPFGLLSALEILRKNTDKKIEVNVWGLTEEPNDTYKACMQWMIADGVMKLRGNTSYPMQDIYHKSDVILSMSTEETRVVREAYACGVPVICGRGPLHFNKSASADSIDPENLARVIDKTHGELCKKGRHFRDRLREYAEKNFNVEEATNSVMEIFDRVVSKHGSVNVPKYPGVRKMVATVDETCNKVKEGLLSGKPTCYVRFGDGDLLLIAGADGEKYHKNSPGLQKELTDAFTMVEDGYIVSSVAGMINEGRMRPGLFGRFEYDDGLRNVVESLRPGEVLDNAIALAYKSVFDPEWFIDFVQKCFHGKRILFVGGENLCNSALIKRVFNVSTFVSLPMSNAFYVMNERMDEIKNLTQTHDILICAAGMATRVLAKRLWQQNFKISFIDIGSIADGIAGVQDTRTWLRLVGDSYRKNFEQAFIPSKTDIIVLSYGNEEKTIRCFEAIAKNTENYRVIWVDNGSGAESIEKVRSAAGKLLDCDLISISKNMGFSKGVNKGLRKFIGDASADYVVLLNNDVIVTPGWLSALIAARVSSGMDAIGPLTSENNPHSLESLRDVLDTLPVFTSESPDERASVLRAKYGTKTFLAGNMLSFFCCMLAKEAVEQAGLLDEQFFAYGEDNDYFEKMRRLGMRFGVALGVYVHHDHGATSDKMGDGWKEARKREAARILEKKWRTAPALTSDEDRRVSVVKAVNCDRLHIGCGDMRLEGFVNVDTRKTDATDFVGDCSDLGFLPEKSFSLVFANAFFEHIRRDRHISFLSSVKRVMRSGGILALLGIPDFEAIARAYIEGKELVPGRKMDLGFVSGYMHGPLHDTDDERKLFAWMHKAPIDKQYLSDIIAKAGFVGYRLFNYCYPGELLDLNLGIISSPDATIEEDSVGPFLSQFDGFIENSTVRIWKP